jgi:Flp pilus assembly protein TadG
MCPVVSHTKIRRTVVTRRGAPRTRSGVAAIEGIIVLSTLLMVLFVVFDFGLATFQYNTLSAVARRVARAASLHGAAAPPEQTAWGPVEYVGTAADNSEIANAASPLLATMSSSAVAIDVTWLDGTNQENDRVRVRISYTHPSCVPFLPGINALSLQAESTMPIVH